MPTIQPFTSGWGIPALVSMLFCPGWMSNGPFFRCTVIAPGRAGSSATVVVVERATVVCGMRVVGAVAGVGRVAGAVEPLLLHAATSTPAHVAAMANACRRCMVQWLDS